MHVYLPPPNINLVWRSVSNMWLESDSIILGSYYVDMWLSTALKHLASWPMKLSVGRAACMPKIKSKETTFPSLNQTGESCSLGLNLASSLACVCLPSPPKQQLGMKECLQHVSQVSFSLHWVKLCWYVTLHCFEALGVLTYEAFGWEGCLYAQDQT